MLRDGGSYSYNRGAHCIDYFGGVASHNSVQFDDADQMPRLGRFLLGDWLTTSRRTPLGEDNSSTRFAVGYENRPGHRHERCVRLTDGRLTVMDEIGGFAHKAVLRWRLAPGLWRLEGETVINGNHRDRKSTRLNSSH